MKRIVSITAPLALLSLASAGFANNQKPSLSDGKTISSNSTSSRSSVDSNGHCKEKDSGRPDDSSHRGDFDASSEGGSAGGHEGNSGGSSGGSSGNGHGGNSGGGFGDGHR